jgi:hypothetical protein
MNRLGSSFAMNTAKIFISVSLIALVVRFVGFYYPAIDWDEAVYALVGSAWLHSEPPYTVVWDNKPPFLYALFAIFEAIIHDPVIAYRLLSLVAVSITATLVSHIAASRGASRHAAFLGALAFCIGSICNGGLATNAEVLMVVFTTAAIMSAIINRPVLAGIWFGTAVMTKHVAVFDGFAILYAIYAIGELSLMTLFRVAVGSLISPVLMIAFLAYSGAFNGFWQGAIIDNLTRISGHFDWDKFKVIVVYQACWLMLYASLLLLRDRLIWFWLLGGAVGITSGKYFYSHYFIQILPALCVAFALAVDRLFVQRKAAVLCAFAFLAPTIASGAYRISLLLRGPHNERAIAAKIPTGASLYVFDGEPILYLLAGSRPPTPYVLPTILTGDRFYNVAHINPLSEVNRIFKSRPEFVVTRPGHLSTTPQLGDENISSTYQLAAIWLSRDYAALAEFPDAVVYKHR